MTSSPAIKRIEDGRRRKKRRAVGAGAGSDSEGSDAGAGPSGAALIVHNPNPAQQSLADLAAAFMSMLNTQSEPPKRTASRPARGPSSAGPIIEEDYSSIPGVGLGDFMGGGGGPVVIGSMPAGPGAGPAADLGVGPASAFASGPLGGDYVPLEGLEGPGMGGTPIVELPSLSGLPSFNLDELNMDNLPDMLTMPSQDLIITDEDLGAALGPGAASEAWNSTVHPPAGQAALPQHPGAQHPNNQPQ